MCVAIGLFGQFVIFFFIYDACWAGRVKNEKRRLQKKNKRYTVVVAVRAHGILSFCPQLGAKNVKVIWPNKAGLYS